MKRYHVARMRLVALLIAGVLASSTFLVPTPLLAQGASEKIRLMADTLRARDSGDLERAKMKAEELIKIAPNDKNVQRLLLSINRDLERRGAPASSRTVAPVFGQAAGITAEAAMEDEMKIAEDDSSDEMVVAAADAQQEKIEAAEAMIPQAELLADLGEYGEARNLLDSAAAGLSLNTGTDSTLDAIQDARAGIIMTEIVDLTEAGSFKEAENLLPDYIQAGGSEGQAKSMASQLNARISDPYKLDINQVSPEYVAQSKTIRDLVARGRAQFIHGDYDGAQASFREVEARDANNAEAKLFQTRIANILGEVHSQNLYKTRQQMLTEVEQQWERPKVFDISTTRQVEEDGGGRIQEKLNQIIIPQVNFSGMELTRVIETLSELSVVYDAEQAGVNIIPLFNPNESNPRVNISLRNLSLDRVLQFVTQQVNFAYDVGGDAVTIQPSDSLGGSSTTVTEFFPISRATVIRLTGFRGGAGGGSAVVDPFAPAPAGGGGSSQNDETQALERFFQSAGVNFELPGTSLAFDGEQLIVTQTRRNLERMRTILRNYNEVKQVEIEAKFLEVNQGDLDEVGFNWTLQAGTSPQFDAGGLPVLDENGNQSFSYDRQFNTGNNRSLNAGFGIPESQSQVIINGVPVANNSAPSLASAIDLASRAGSLFTANGWSVNGYDVDFALRALSRKTGSDLMSAPKVTVLSGKRATITVAQELRYPESYGDIESTVSQSGGGIGGGGGSAAVSITAGTPQDFVSRNVGVEMSVTPNVENDDTISLILEPRVTEFEGFVEYGGPSVAIAGDTTVSVPAGFYQPVFSTREMSTEVTVFDGATVVMGGLTRDEIKTINDQVPLLGDIPGVGRLFRSEGETRQKRNLLIFVTANLVSPGGSPANQGARNLQPNSLFQNPTITTPSGTTNRTISEE